MQLTDLEPAEWTCQGYREEAEMNAQQQAERQAAWKLAAEIDEVLLREGWTIVGGADWTEIRQAGKTVRVEGEMPWIAPEVFKQAEKVWPMRTIMTAAGIHE